MDESRGKSELEAVIDAVDKLHPSPEIRAQVVWEVLQRHASYLTVWDVVCFCVNFLGWQVHNLKWLEFPIKHVLKLVYTAHYQDKETDISTGLKRDGGKQEERKPEKQFGPHVEGGGFS